MSGLRHRAIFAAIFYLMAVAAAGGQQPPVKQPPVPQPPVQQPQQAGPPAGERPAARRQAGARPRPASELPNGEWLEPNRRAPSGTQYKTFASEVLAGKEVSYLIYLPEGYDQATTRYPVIYWLHGMGGNQAGGAMMFLPQVQAAVREGVLPPAIVVLVNGMVKSFYCDSSDGQRPVESVIVKDLIPHVDATYRTIAKREGRLIEGYSMGGYGAAHLGLKYPELFAAVVVNAGALLSPDVANIPKDGPMFGVFGADNARRRAEHPRELARANADQLRGRTRIRIGCGSRDHLLAVNQDLHEVLGELEIDHQYEVVPDVAHEGARYYQMLGTKAFEFHRQAFGAAETSDSPVK